MVSHSNPNDQLAQYYPDGAPIIIQVAFKYGYGPSIIELNKKVYFNDSLSFSPVIREAIQGLWLSHCENQYCTVMHARGLITEGFTLEEVKNLVAFHRLPASVSERNIWEPSLARVYHLAREPLIAPTLYSSLTEYLSDEQLDDVSGVIAFSLLHKFLLERYSSEIRIEEEPILFQTVDCGQELINLLNDQERPAEYMHVICSLCKALKTTSSWMPIEVAINDLKPDCQFSHGLCESCATNWKASFERSAVGVNSN